MTDSKMNQMLAAVFRNLNEEPDVDWNTVASETGNKYVRNAQAAFKKYRQRLIDAGSSAAGANDNSETSTPTKKTNAGKVTAKKRKGDAGNANGHASENDPPNSKKQKKNVKKSEGVATSAKDLSVGGNEAPDNSSKNKSGGMIEVSGEGDNVAVKKEEDVA